MTPYETTTIIFMSGLTLIYLATCEKPKRLIIALLKSLRDFFEFIYVFVAFCIWMPYDAIRTAKMRRIKKRAERQIKSGNIYSKKQV